MKNQIQVTSFDVWYISLCFSLGSRGHHQQQPYWNRWYPDYLFSYNYLQEATTKNLLVKKKKENKKHHVGLLFKSYLDWFFELNKESILFGNNILKE